MSRFIVSSIVPCRIAKLSHRVSQTGGGLIDRRLRFEDRVPCTRQLGFVRYDIGVDRKALFKGSQDAAAAPRRIAVRKSL
jgi:hypothetical protein